MTVRPGNDFNQLFALAEARGKLKQFEVDLHGDIVRALDEAFAADENFSAEHIAQQHELDKFRRAIASRDTAELAIAEEPIVPADSIFAGQQASELLLRVRMDKSQPEKTERPDLLLNALDECELTKGELAAKVRLWLVATQIRRFYQDGRHGTEDRATINLTADSFDSKYFREKLDGFLDLAKQSGYRGIILEMTEDKPWDVAIPVLPALTRCGAVKEMARKYGVGIWIDDFGKGCHTETCLTKFGDDMPFGKFGIKVDGPIVKAALHPVPGTSEEQWLADKKRLVDCVEIIHRQSQSRDIKVTFEWVGGEPADAVKLRQFFVAEGRAELSRHVQLIQDRNIKLGADAYLAEVIRLEKLVPAPASYKITDAPQPMAS